MNLWQPAAKSLKGATYSYCNTDWQNLSDDRATGQEKVYKCFVHQKHSNDMYSVNTNKKRMRKKFPLFAIRFILKIEQCLVISTNRSLFATIDLSVSRFLSVFLLTTKFRSSLLQSLSIMALRSNFQKILWKNSDNNDK